mmetsp:Transcript_61698/g.132633  ORF Transcript_61698/g.132633 Transcript_61698/m.132633 type:complete len:216 (+) Transcript_61698:125-772(+)
MSPYCLAPNSACTSKRLSGPSGGSGTSGMLPSSISAMRSTMTVSSLSVTPKRGPNAVSPPSRLTAAALISEISAVMPACRFLLKSKVRDFTKSAALSVAAFIAFIREESSEAWASKRIERSCEFKYKGNIELRIVAGGWSKITSDSMVFAFAAGTFSFFTPSFPSSDVILKVSSSALSMPVGDRGKRVWSVGSLTNKFLNFAKTTSTLSTSPERK